MRLIPGKTKVKIELFKGITLADVIVGLAGLSLATLCTMTSFKFRWILALVVASIFAFLLFRLDDDPMYVFLWHMLRYKAYPRRYQRVYTDEALLRLANGTREDTLDAFFEGGEKSEEEKEEDEEAAKLEKQQLKEIIKEENKILKSKTATEEEKDAVWAARAKRTAEKKKNKAGSKEADASFTEVSELMPFTGIKDDFIEYDGKYYGAVIEIDPVEFRFFSQYRRDNSIENCFGKILRGLTGDYGANIVKLQRPIIYDEYLAAEYDKLDELKKSYESGLLTEDELKARVEIQYDRINEVRNLCKEDKVIESFYYLVLFESDKNRLEVIARQAVNDLEQGELTVTRLRDKELALFLKYSNYLDFDEHEIDNIPEEKWTEYAMPESLKFSMRRIEVNGIVTHNMRVISFPTVVGDSWLAGVMSFPSTKVVVKATPMDNAKAIRAIDRSLSELRGQYMATNVDSKMIELQEHIDTLSTLLVTLQQDNEVLMSVNVYITAYDARATQQNPLLSENFETLMPYVSDMKKTVKRSWSEAGMKLSGMDFLQIQSFIGSQISAYDPMVKEARGIPSNTIAGMFPWIFAHISDVGGIQLGTSDDVPVFIDFFRRDEERVNSNMVIVGKSGSGKSYATKSLLTNLASEDAKIFILDPENEYSELAHNLHGKIINVGNAQYGRLNPFHIITALDDDEAGEEGGGPGGSFATHLQFLEEFFKQILPDIDRDALEFLNSLIERMYLNFGITPDTNLSELKASDYPIFDDLYDIVLAEFERTNNEYLRQLLRSLVNYISKFATGGRNANIWNGPSTITTDENFSVFNFQAMLANRNSTIANAQMLLVLKYIDNEIIKNRDYNIKYGLKRKIVVVIDEAHVFIDNKYPIALDFMFQLAKRIRKYNGMQIVITQNIKDFVGSEEIARKSTAIINACQYSFVFGLAPNDMNDLCKLYEKAGGINEREQEDILNAKRGQAFTIMSPTSRSSFAIEVPDSFVEMFEDKNFESYYFTGEEGEENWEKFVKDSREIHDQNYDERKKLEEEIVVEKEYKSTLTFSEISEDEADRIAAEYARKEAEEKLAERLKSLKNGEEDDQKAEQEQRQGAVDKRIAAEDAVNRKEYEMAMGRFGGINLQEISEEEAEEYEEDYEEDYDYESEDDYDETLEENPEEDIDEYESDEYESDEYESDEYESDEYESDEYDDDYEYDEDDSINLIESSSVNSSKKDVKKASNKNAKKDIKKSKTVKKNGSGIPARKAEYGEKLYTEQEMSRTLSETLDAFKKSIREEISRELEDKIKWISLGAGLVSSGAQIGAQTNTQMDSQVRTQSAQYGASAGQASASVTTKTEYEDDLDYDTEDEEYTGFNFGLDDEDEEFSFDSDFDSSSDYDSDYDEDLEDELDDELEDESEDDYDYDFDDDDEDEDEDDEFSFASDSDDEDEDDFDSLFANDDDDDYEPAPFLFAELLAEAAEEYAEMGIEERMEESGDEVLEITVEELSDYIKKQRKAK